MAKLTFRSYDIEQNYYGGWGAVPNHVGRGESFETVLDRIAQLDFANRGHAVTPDCLICLSRYEPEQNGNKIFGEFIRVRSNDFPMIVAEDGVREIPLPNANNNIGKGAVFCYDIIARCLYMQYAKSIVPDSRAMYYMNNFSNNTSFHAHVKPKEDIWGQLERGAVRKVMIRVASPNNFQALVGDEDAELENIFNTMGQAYAAPSIYVEMSVGRVRECNLADRIKRQLRNLCDNRYGENFEVKSVKAQVEEDGIAEVINLIDDVLSTQEDIDLPKNDPEENYRIRKALLVTLMARNAFEG